MTIEELYEKINLGEDVDTEFKSAKDGLQKSLFICVPGGMTRYYKTKVTLAKGQKDYEIAWKHFERGIK